MTALNFPASPNNGDTFANGDVTYTWDGVKWTAKGANPGHVLKAGDTMTGNLTVPSLNTGQLAGFRNQVMNGAMDINQRVGPYTHAVAAAVAPCLDRWFMSGNPANTISVQQFSLPTGPFAKAIQWQSADVNTTALNLIELPAAGTPGPFRNGTTWTLSVYSNIAPPFGQLLWTTASTAGGTPAAGAPVAFADTGEDTGTPGWKRYSATFTINSTPAAGDKALEVAIFLPSGASYFTGVQLEPGPVATPFEHRPIGTELALCQRYYQEVRLAVAGEAANGGSEIKYSYALGKMRAQPTLVEKTVHATGNGNGILQVNSDNAIIFGITRNAAGAANAFRDATVTANSEL